MIRNGQKISLPDGTVIESVSMAELPANLKSTTQQRRNLPISRSVCCEKNWRRCRGF